tara:strand:+ start:84 stop:635 length:552 start_codon:yes stop_codon:yes gene_type:complete
MSILTTGKTFANGEQLSAEKLNQVITGATFNASDAVDGSSITLIGGAIAVNDGGVTFAKLADVIDSDTMTGASATKLATSESIKAYVDSNPNFTPSTYASEESVTFPNGLIMKFGTVTVSANTTTAVNFGTAFNATVSAQLTYQEASVNDRYSIKIDSLSNSTLTIRDTSSFTGTVHWQVIGR